MMMRLAVRGLRWLIFLTLLAGSLALVAGAIATPLDHDDSMFLRFSMCVLIGMVPLAYGSRAGQYGDRMVAAMTAMSGELGGAVEHRGLLDPDFDWRWTKHDVRAHLNAWIDDFETSGKNNVPPSSARYRFRYTVEVPASAARMRLDVRPETVLEAAAKMFGMQDLSLGQPDIDRQLIVQASDRAEYDRCLQRGLAQRLADFLKLSKDMSVAHVSYAPGRLVVQRAVRVIWDDATEAQTVRAMHDATFALLLAITELDVLGVRGAVVGEVLVVAAAPEGAACLVCGQTIAAAIVACTRCDTPHHCDCWEYNGGCALYACGSQKARPVRVAAVT